LKEKIRKVDLYFVFPTVDFDIWNDFALTFRIPILQYFLLIKFQTLIFRKFGLTLANTSKVLEDSNHIKTNLFIFYMVGINWCSVPPQDLVVVLHTQDASGDTPLG
jgi:hypothetical protein